MPKYFQAPWKIKDIVLVVVGTILMLIAYLLAMELLGVTEVVESGKSGGLLISLVFLFQWICMILPLLIVSKKYKLSKKMFALRKVKISRLILLIIQSYLLYFVISFAIGAAILYFNLEIPGYQAQEEVLPYFGEGIFNMIIAAVIIAIIAPVIEEILFRGFLLRSLSNYLGVIWGSTISAAIFSLMHFPWQSFIPIFILGLIINSMVIRTKSIVPAIIFHVLNNSIAFAIQLLLLNDIIQIEKLV